MNGWVIPDQVTRVVVSNPNVKGGDTTMFGVPILSWDHRGVITNDC